MAKEGLKFTLPLGIGCVGVLFTPLKLAAIPFFILTIFTIFFFRDPKRMPPLGDDIILAPADGEVVFAGDYEGDFGRRKRIGIFMRIYDVHINRIPFSGVVEEIVYLPGKFLIASKDIAPESNERNILKVKTDKGDYIIIQVAGKLARRIVCRVKKGEKVKRGERFGMIMFGSRVEILLPPSTQILIRKGDKVKGGETIIGRMI